MPQPQILAVFHWSVTKHLRFQGDIGPPLNYEGYQSQAVKYFGMEGLVATLFAKCNLPHKWKCQQSMERASKLILLLEQIMSVLIHFHWLATHRFDWQTRLLKWQAGCVLQGSGAVYGSWTKMHWLAWKQIEPRTLASMFWNFKLYEEFQTCLLLLLKNYPRVERR